MESNYVSVLMFPGYTKLFLHIGNSTRKRCLYRLSRDIKQTYGSVSHNVRLFIKMGLVQITKDNKDMKSKYAALTPKGKKIYEDIKNVYSYLCSCEKVLLLKS